MTPLGLVFAPLLIATATAVELLIMLAVINVWFRSWSYDDSRSGNGVLNWVWRNVKRSTTILPRAVQKSAEKRLASALSHAVASRMPAAVRTLDQLTNIVARTGDTFVAEAKQTHDALYALRHVTVPALIAGALRDPLRRLGVVEAQASAATQTLTGISTAFADGLRSLPWGVPLGIGPRVQTFFTTYKRLWDQVWTELSPRVSQLWTQIVPELRQRIEDLERAVQGAGGGAIGQLRQRVTALENQAGNIIIPRIANLEAAVAALSDEVFGAVGTGLLELVERVAALEERVDDFIATTYAALEARVTELERALDAAIDDILDRFGDRIVELERQVTDVIPQRLAALELAVDTLVATALEGLEVGLIDLTGRIVSLETQVRDVILPGIDALVGRVTALEERIENAILPRLEALEGLLAPAAFAALVLATMRTVAPNLFCRNTTAVTQRVCGLDENMLAQLLAGTLVWALVVDPRALLVAGQTVERGIDGVVRTIADV